MGASDADVNIADLAIGHGSGFTYRSSNGVGGGVNIHHHAFTQAERRLLAKTDDVDLLLGVQLGNQCHYLGGANVQRCDQLAHD